MSIYEFIISVYLFIDSCYSLIVTKPLRTRGFPPALTDIEIINLSSMKYFSFLASFGKLAYLDLSNKPL